MKPRIALLLHHFRCREGGHQVYMIRHHYKITHAILLAVEMQERVGYDLGQFRPLEQTTAMTRIQERFAAAIERLVEVRPILVGKRLDDARPVSPGIPAALTQPLLFEPIPAYDDVARNGIACSNK